MPPSNQMQCLPHSCGPYTSLSSATTSAALGSQVCSCFRRVLDLLQELSFVLLEGSSPVPPQGRQLGGCAFISERLKKKSKQKNNRDMGTCKKACGLCFLLFRWFFFLIIRNKSL